MFVGLKDIGTANRLFSSVRREEKRRFASGHLDDAPPVIALEMAARDGGLGRPAYHSVWDADAKTLTRFSDEKVRVVTWPLGLFVGFAADGSAVYVSNVEEDYPYPYGSYDDGDGGSTISHDSTINIGCDTGSGNIIGDVVRYTTVGLIRRGRLYLTISMEVLEEDKILVETECKEIIDLATLTLECIAGVPTLDFESDYVRSIVCKPCG